MQSNTNKENISANVLRKDCYGINGLNYLYRFDNRDDNYITSGFLLDPKKIAFRRTFPSVVEDSLEKAIQNYRISENTVNVILGIFVNGVERKVELTLDRSNGTIPITEVRKVLEIAINHDSDKPLNFYIKESYLEPIDSISKLKAA